MNRTLFAADCLDVLNNGAALPDASFGLIYLYLPFYGYKRRGVMLGL